MDAERSRILFVPVGFFSLIRVGTPFESQTTVNVTEKALNSALFDRSHIVRFKSPPRPLIIERLFEKNTDPEERRTRSLQVSFCVPTIHCVFVHLPGRVYITGLLCCK